MAAMQTLLIVAALGQTPADTAELAKAQSALESYYTRISTLHITYSSKWMPPSPRGYQSENPNWDPTLSDDYDLLYAYPSIRMKIVERRKNQDGNVVEHERETLIHNGKRIGIDYTNKEFNTISSSSDFPTSEQPVNALGLRVLHTLNTPLSEFLRLPDITSFRREESIEGERAIVMEVGPQIPPSIRPNGWSHDATIKLWLAPQRHYLPLRTEVRRRNSRSRYPNEVIRLSAGSFRDVQDLARGTTVPFPFLLAIEWANGGKTTMEVRSAVMNATVSEQDFVMTPPKGYFVAVDGKPQSLSGGALQREDLVKTTADEAKRLIGTLDPPRSTAPLWHRWPVAVTILAILGMAVVFFYKLRRDAQ